MVQKLDKELKDSKKSIKSSSAKNDTNQPQQLDKKSNHKTERTHKHKFDPSGLPKYR